MYYLSVSLFIFDTDMLKSVSPYINSSATKKEQVAAMFNTISNTYDFLNRMLSLGIDTLWRKKAIEKLIADGPKSILDVATGTGDFAFKAIDILQPESIIGVDISEGMLAIAKKKIARKKLGDIFEVRMGDSERLLFDDHLFDAVTVAYGVRNFENLKQGMADMLRVLKLGGRVVILEFSKPQVFPIKQGYNFYFNYVVPTIGKFFSKDSSAYAYLPASVASFPDGDDFLAIMKEIGFKEVTCSPLAFGICSIYTGVK